MILMSGNVKVYDATNREVLNDELCPGCISYGKGEKEYFDLWLKSRRTYFLNKSPNSLNSLVPMAEEWLATNKHAIDDLPIREWQWDELDRKTLGQSPIDNYWFFYPEDHDRDLQPTYPQTILPRADFTLYLGTLPHMFWEYTNRTPNVKLSDLASTPNVHQQEKMNLYKNTHNQITQSLHRWFNNNINNELAAELKQNNPGQQPFGTKLIYNKFDEPYYWERLSFSREYLLSLKNKAPYPAIAELFSPSLALDLSLADAITDYKKRDQRNIFLVRQAKTGKLLGLAPITYWGELPTFDLHTLNPNLFEEGLNKSLSHLNLDWVITRTGATPEQVKEWLASRSWDISTKPSYQRLNTKMLIEGGKFARLEKR